MQPVFRASAAAFVIVATRARSPPANPDQGGIARTRSCPHCDIGQAYPELLAPTVNTALGGGAHGGVDVDVFKSDVHVMWSTHVEVVPLTTDIGGWLSPSFHAKLAKEAIQGWKTFHSKTVPSLPEEHRLREAFKEGRAGAANDAFYQWQKSLFQSAGELNESFMDEPDKFVTPPLGSNSTWPKLQALPEYAKLRKVVERLSRRYLVRSGMEEKSASTLNYSIFSWAGIHRPGEFHEPHTHLGFYHVAVFYAQVPSTSGKLRFSDPRGHSPPYGKSFSLSPRAGDLVVFPSWLAHMATVTGASSDVGFSGTTSAAAGDDNLRVVFSFNLGPADGPMRPESWWSDPLSDLRFHARVDASQST